jgi:hypothetical protein
MLCFLLLKIGVFLLKTLLDEAKIDFFKKKNSSFFRGNRWKYILFMCLKNQKPNAHFHKTFVTIGMYVCKTYIIEMRNRVTFDVAYESGPHCIFHKYLLSTSAFKRNKPRTERLLIINVYILLHIAPK